MPSFNEATWTRYPDQVGHITAHRDPPAYQGVIAVFTLIGTAVFRIWNDLDSTIDEWATMPGDVIVLQGKDWPRPGALCPRHEVEQPFDGDRLIMTLRFNSRGAGGGYDVSGFVD